MQRDLDRVQRCLRINVKSGIEPLQGIHILIDEFGHLIGRFLADALSIHTENGRQCYGLDLLGLVIIAVGGNGVGEVDRIITGGQLLNLLVGQSQRACVQEFITLSVVVYVLPSAPSQRRRQFLSCPFCSSTCHLSANGLFSFRAAKLLH